MPIVYQLLLNLAIEVGRGNEDSHVPVFYAGNKPHHRFHPNGMVQPPFLRLYVDVEEDLVEIMANTVLGDGVASPVTRRRCYQEVSESAIHHLNYVSCSKLEL